MSKYYIHVYYKNLYKYQDSQVYCLSTTTKTWIKTGTKFSQLSPTTYEEYLNLRSSEKNQIFYDTALKSKNLFYEELLGENT